MPSCNVSSNSSSVNRSSLVNRPWLNSHSIRDSSPICYKSVSSSRGGWGEINHSKCQEGDHPIPIPYNNNNNNSNLGIIA